MIAPLAKPVIMFMCFHLLDPFLNQKLSNNKPDKQLQNAINESGHDIEWLFPWGVRIVRFSCLFCLIRDWPTAQTTRKMSTLYVHVVKWLHVSCTSWGGVLPVKLPMTGAKNGCASWGPIGRRRLFLWWSGALLLWPFHASDTWYIHPACPSHSSGKAPVGVSDPCSSSRWPSHRQRPPHIAPWPESLWTSQCSERYRTSPCSCRSRSEIFGHSASSYSG